MEMVAVCVRQGASVPHALDQLVLSVNQSWVGL